MEYKKNLFHVENISTEKLAKKFDTPLYCYSYLKLKNNIILLGYKENIFKYLKDARAFLLTSLWEDPGFVLVESAYCNIPIISSDCKNGPEEFLNYGKGGMLFKSNSKISFL